MDTLFYVISIGGLVAVTFWAFLNDRCDSISEQSGIFAMKAPLQRGDPVQQTADARSTLSSTSNEPSSAPRSPRRRFISS